MEYINIPFTIKSTVEYTGVYQLDVTELQEKCQGMTKEDIMQCLTDDVYFAAKDDLNVEMYENAKVKLNIPEKVNEIINESI